METEFKNASKTVLSMLKNAGFEAFLIGGSVRDFIMGREIGDVDVTTNAVPDEVKAVFSDFRVIDTGIKHGTVTVLVENEPVEITTYRSESGYSDNRRPDSVSFSHRLSDDVIRRDFTMNGVAYNFEDGFCDLVGGIGDIKNGVIRCIGNPEERFREDALRILRAIRFSSVLGFAIEAETKKAVHSCRNLLNNISAERIREEFCKLLCGENASAVLAEFSDVIGVFIPEILPSVGFDQKNRHHIYDVYGHILKSVEASKRDLTVRLALYFHDIGKVRTATADENGELHFYGHPKRSAESADEIMKRLRFDNETRENVVTLIRCHDYPISVRYGDEPDRKRLKRLTAKVGKKLIYDIIEVKRCDNLAHAPEYIIGEAFYKKTYEMLDEIILGGECITLSSLKINGNDLIEMGYEGRKIGEKLNECLNAVIDEKIRNEYNELKKFVKS